MQFENHFTYILLVESFKTAVIDLLNLVVTVTVADISFIFLYH